MGSVTFGIPLDLARDLVRAGGLAAAVETGTYLGDSAIALRGLVDAVWTIELLPEIHAQAVARIGDRSGVAALLGYSPTVLASISGDVPGPALFWLDGHGGTFGGDDVPAGARECPVLEELAAIEKFDHADRACILIDDARAFFGPMLRHRPEEWPTFLEVADALRAGGTRYVTVLDDVVIAVPSDLRAVVDAWWTAQLRSRDGLEALQHRVRHLQEPPPVEAFKRFARSIAPAPVRDGWTRWRTRDSHGQ